MIEGTVIVTGADGFLGAAVVRRALAQRQAVHAVVRSATRLRRLDTSLPGLSIHEIELDTPDAGERLSALGRAPIIDLSGAPPQALEDGVPLARENINCALNAISAASRTGARIVLAGSSREYGDVAGRIAETQVPQPNTAYGAGKYAVTELALGLARAGKLDPIVLRPFIVYGPGQGGGMFVPVLARRCACGERFDMTGGEQRRDFLFIDDAADAFLAAAAVTTPAVARVINIGSGVATRLLDVAQMLAATFDATGLLNVGAIPYRKSESMEFVPDVELAERALDWRSRTSLRDGLHRVADDERRRCRESVNG